MGRCLVSLVEVRAGKQDVPPQSTMATIKPSASDEGRCIDLSGTDRMSAEHLPGPEGGIHGASAGLGLEKGGREKVPAGKGLGPWREDRVSHILF